MNEGYTPSAREVERLYVWACMQGDDQQDPSVYKEEFKRFMGEKKEKTENTVIGPWTSHGHKIPTRHEEFPASAKPTQIARCGGPGLCKVCTSESGMNFRPNTR